MAKAAGWDDMFVHTAYFFDVDLSWNLDKGNFVENPFSHLTHLIDLR